MNRKKVGRLNRASYWKYVAGSFLLIATINTYTLGLIFGRGPGNGELGIALQFISALILLRAAIGRVHDLNRSALWLSVPFQLIAVAGGFYHFGHPNLQNVLHDNLLLSAFIAAAYAGSLTIFLLASPPPLSWQFLVESALLSLRTLPT